MIIVVLVIPHEWLGRTYGDICHQYDTEYRLSIIYNTLFYNRKKYTISGSHYTHLENIIQ